MFSRLRSTVPHAPAPGASRLRSGLAVAVVLALLGAGLATIPAAADTSPANPANPRTPETASPDSLPTVQIDGVVWSQVVVGNTVYAVGNFATARPAGAAPGASTVTRSNALAYDIRTGALNTSWTPDLNAQALAVTASADGQTIYVGGDFTRINGKIRNRIAALDATTGEPLWNFTPKPDARVRAITVTDDTVYFGGNFSSVGATGGTTVTRTRVAAAQVSDGALLPWAPQLAGGIVYGLAASPTADKVLIVGDFTSMNGSSNPGYGMGAADAATGANLPWKANSVIRNAGDRNTFNTSATSDGGSSVYTTGVQYRKTVGGELEGSARMSWDDGSLIWIQDCHGDTYSAYPQDDAVYVVGHAHYCGNVDGGFRETSPRSHHRALAYSKQATVPLLPNTEGTSTYFNFGGQPGPSLLNFWPDIDFGSFTGQNQGAWNVTGNNEYLVLGGEFLSVNGTSQQGLVRMAKKGASTNSRDPEVSGSKFNPTVSSPQPGAVRLNWTANWDMDNKQLTYKVLRNSVVIHEEVAESTWFSRPALSFIEYGLTPGATYRYRVYAVDKYGNDARSDSVNVTVTAGDPVALGSYGQAVIDADASNYWRLDEPSGVTVSDYGSSGNPGTVWAASRVTRTQPGALVEDSNTSTRFLGTSDSYVYTSGARPAPDVFTVQAWFKTNTTRGGKIVGFGNGQGAASAVYDRHVYMDNAGRLHFGTWTGSAQMLDSTTSYNDNQWHQVVASLGANGMRLYVDGDLVAERDDVTSGRQFNGFWRIGGDALSSAWPYPRASSYIDATLDEVAVYPTVLGPSTVADLYQLARQATPNQPPTASFTASVDRLDVTVDGSGSSDADGTVESYGWDFGDGGTAAGATATHSYAAAGTYPVKLTVTDDDGATDTMTKTVTAVDPAPAALASDAFTRTVSDGWGSADFGGAWTRLGSANRFSVAGGVGSIRMATAGDGPKIVLDQVSSDDTDMAATFTVDRAATGGGTYVSVIGRRIDSNLYYRTKVKIGSDNTMRAYLTRVVAGTETTLDSTLLPTSFTPGAGYRIRMQTVGSNPTQLTAKMWPVGGTEPAGWQLNATDTTPTLQTSGGIGFMTYLSGSATNAPQTATFDNLTAERTAD